MDRVAVFVDVQNIYYTVKQEHNCHFDYNAFWEEVTRGRKLVKAFAYATFKGDQKQTGFQNILRKIGFEVKLIPYIQRKDGSTKADWDVGIAVDMMNLAKDADVVVLASGDGDYAAVVDDIKARHGVSVEVYGVRSLTAASLVKSASRFVPIEGNLIMPIPKTW